MRFVDEIIFRWAEIRVRLSAHPPSARLLRLALAGVVGALLLSGVAVGFSMLFRPGGEAWTPLMAGGWREFSAAEKAEFRRRVMTGRFSGVTVTEYTVKPGDNFWRIGRDFGVDVHTVVGANPWLKDFRAAVGEVLLVPDRKGVLHEVGPGETLKSVAELYGVPPSRIVEANGGLPAFVVPVAPGRILFVPDAMPKRVSERIASYYARRRIFISPMAGAYTSGFGWRVHPVTGVRTFHTGLDIRARSGTPVHAAGAGVVTVAADLAGYGLTVVIDHGNGLTTLYAHNSRLVVRQGQRVVKGQRIAYSGRTGTATGPHLHFEVRRNGTPEDPALYLW